ncbi:MAG: DUF4830 domain-containing protein [Chloroflexota bacterium]
MRLSRKPAAVRRRRILLAVVALAAVSAAAALIFRPDAAHVYATSLGFSHDAAPARERLRLPTDLTQAPYDSYLSASRAAGLDFAGYAGREITHVTYSIGRVSGTEQQVYLNIYLSGRKVVGAFLTGADRGEAATPVNSPNLALDPLVP